MKRIALVVASILLVTFAATAQMRRGPGPMAGPGGPAGNNHVLADYLSLTQQQAATWETIQAELHTTGRTLHEQEHAIAEQLESATDASTIGNLVLQMRSIHTQLEAAKAAADAKFAALLTPEQQTKFAAFEAATDFLRSRGPGGPGPRP